jgi:hypothetical protein
VARPVLARFARSAPPPDDALAAAAPRPGSPLAEVLLYDLNDSPFCLKARICLNLKGVPFRRVPLTVARMREPGASTRSAKCRSWCRRDRSSPIRAASSATRSRASDPALVPIGLEAHAYACLLEEWADEALYFIVGAFKG